MNERKLLISQYYATLEMLKQTILHCPAARWESREPQTPFGQVAYHALFYTHLYLQDSLQTFTPWPQHQERYLPSEQPAPSLPDKTTVLEYLAFCQQQVVDKIAETDLTATASGFDWLPFGKLELQLYSIRHIQQHVGELMERLGPDAQAIDWIGLWHA